MRLLRSAIPALVVALVLLTGGVLRVSALRPTGWLPATAYNWLFTLHGALMLAMLPLMLLWFAPQVRERHVLIVLGLQGLCLLPTIVGLIVPSPALMAAVFGAVAASVAALAFVPSATSRGPRAVFVVAAAVQSAAWFAGWSSPSDALGLAFSVLVTAVVVAPAISSASFALPIVATAYLASRAAVRYAGTRPMALAQVAAMVAVVALVGAATKSEQTAWARWVRRIEALTFLEGVLLASFLGSLDSAMHLHDTYAAIAGAHFEGFVLVFAMLRGADRAAGSWFGWCGLGLAAAGAHLFAWTLVVLGTRGMPRRYVSYLPQFAPLQQLATTGAVVFLVGVTMIVAATALRTRRALS